MSKSTHIEAVKEQLFRYSVHLKILADSNSGRAKDLYEKEKLSTEKSISFLDTLKEEQRELLTEYEIWFEEQVYLDPKPTFNQFLVERGEK